MPLLLGLGRGSIPPAVLGAVLVDSLNAGGPWPYPHSTCLWGMVSLVLPTLLCGNLRRILREPCEQGKAGSHSPGCWGISVRRDSVVPVLFAQLLHRLLGTQGLIDLLLRPAVPIPLNLPLKVAPVTSHLPAAPVSPFLSCELVHLWLSSTSSTALLWLLCVPSK